MNIMADMDRAGEWGYRENDGRREYDQLRDHGAPQHNPDRHRRPGHRLDVAHAELEIPAHRSRYHLRERLRHGFPVLPEPGLDSARPVPAQPPHRGERVAAGRRQEVPRPGSPALDDSHLAPVRGLPDGA